MAAKPMIRILGIEVVQCIQNLQNEIPLLANKITIVRVYVRPTSLAVDMPVTGTDGVMEVPGRLLEVNECVEEVVRRSVKRVSSETPSERCSGLAATRGAGVLGVGALAVGGAEGAGLAGLHVDFEHPLAAGMGLEVDDIDAVAVGNAVPVAVERGQGGLQRLGTKLVGRVDDGGPDIDQLRLRQILGQGRGRRDVAQARNLHRGGMRRRHQVRQVVGIGH